MPSNISFNLPIRNAFSGRADELKTMTETFNHTDCRILVLAGIEGIGKSALALAYANLNPSWHTIWVKGAQLKEDFVSLSQHMELPPSDNIPDAVKTWLRDNTGWLLIIDDVSSPDVVAPYLPDSHPNGFVIITSRSKYWGKFPVLEIDPLLENDAVNLLKEILSRVNDDSLARLAIHLACIPSELQRVAYQIRGNNHSVDKYVNTIPKINFTKLKNGFKNYTVFFDPPIPQSSFKATPPEVTYSLQKYLNDRDLIQFSQTSTFFEKLFNQEIADRSAHFFGDNRKCVNGFFACWSVSGSAKKIKELFEEKCRQQEMQFNGVSFEGDGCATDLVLEDGDNNLDEKPNVSSINNDLEMNNRAVESVAIKINHDFLPPALRNILNDESLLFVLREAFPYKQYIDSDLTIDFKNHHRQTLFLTVDPMPGCKLSESKGHLQASIISCILSYKLSFQGKISQNGRSIALSEIFPEYVKEDRVVFEVIAPMAYRRIDYCPEPRKTYSP